MRGRQSPRRLVAKSSWQCPGERALHPYRPVTRGLAGVRRRQRREARKQRQRGQFFESSKSLAGVLPTRQAHERLHPLPRMSRISQTRTFPPSPALAAQHHPTPSTASPFAPSTFSSFAPIRRPSYRRHGCGLGPRSHAPSSHAKELLPRRPARVPSTAITSTCPTNALFPATTAMPSSAQSRPSTLWLLRRPKRPRSRLALPRTNRRAMARRRHRDSRALRLRCRCRQHRPASMRSRPGWPKWPPPKPAARTRPPSPRDRSHQFSTLR